MSNFYEKTVKLFFVYVSEKSHITIRADKWKREADSLVFYKDGKIIAWFNSNNIAGMCECRVYYGEYRV